MQVARKTHKGLYDWEGESMTNHNITRTIAISNESAINITNTTCAREGCGVEGGWREKRCTWKLGGMK